ncbi:MAG: MoxR family ATPase [Acidimicrobiales bacterium]|nr:MoxR family ATPase [Acidimicrobiales bacterium]
MFAGTVRNIEQIIQGKAEVIELVVLCLVAEGHLLIEDRPGVGKTTLAKALAASLETTFGRIQFTPDLLPSDVVGVTVFDRSASEFTFRPGPVFSSIVLADEINRASPKTQSALLEAMAEKQVTVDGQTYALPRPHLVLATQNPIEHEGTYPLPDSQLDRFLMRLSMGYPSRADEIAILDAHGQTDGLEHLTAVLTTRQLDAMVAAARAVHVAPAIKEYLVDLSDASRRHPYVWVGLSPRATLAMQRVCRARAAAAGRNYVTPDDVKALAEPVMAHRLMLNPDAQLQGLTASRVVADILAQVPVPVPTNR